MISATKSLLFVLCVLLNVAFFTLAERKVLGYIQTRKGPNKVGFKGIFQPFSDAIKLFTKSMNHLNVANSWVFLVSPTMTLGIMLSLWMATPSLWGLTEVSLSAIYLLSCMSLSVYPVFMSGWASNSKYSLLGGLRAIAQTISYEVSLALVLLGFIVLMNSLSLSSFFSESGWMLGMVLPVLSGIWVITCLAETGRSPFDLPEGESELVSGFNTEYSSGAFALFFLGEYGSMLFLSYITSMILVGSGVLDLINPLKCMMIVFVFIWARGTLPRYRYDNLMELTWKGFLPISLCYLLFYMSIVLYFSIE